VRQLWVVARNDLSITLYDKQAWLLWLALPVLVIYLAGLGAQGFAQRGAPIIRVDVMDQDRSPASQTFAATLAGANPVLLVCPATDDLQDACRLAGASLTPALAQERLADEVTFGAIAIPAGFASALVRGDEVTVQFRSNAASAASEIAFRAVQNVAAAMGAPAIAARLSTQAAEALGIETGPEFYAARLAEAHASWGTRPAVQVLSETTGPDERLLLGGQLLENGYKLSTPAISAMFVMISVLGMAQSLAEDRALGILRRLGTMPLGRGQWLGGKLLATFLLGWVQFVVLLAFGQILGVDFGRAPLAMLLVGAAYVLAATALAMAVAALARTTSQASAIATSAWLILVPLGGGWWPLALVPDWMQTLGHLSPVAWCLDALNALIFYQGTLADILLPVGVLLLFAVGLFAVGVGKLDCYHTGGDEGLPALPYFGSGRHG
jgi:ABC-2 type transport system permease protein